jgi:DNA-binding NarL/FixJ family response regulator
MAGGQSVPDSKGGGREILIVDGDPAVRDKVVRELRRLDYEVVAATTGHDGLTVARSLQPALVLLDVQLPEMTGYELCTELREEFGAELAIVMTSADRTEPSDRVAGLLIGADEYLAKPLDLDHLVATVRRFVARPASAGRRQRSSLTPREVEVLQMLARGLRTAEIAADLVITVKTVRTHIQNVLTKLGVHTQAQAVAWAYRHGLTDGDYSGVT